MAGLRRGPAAAWPHAGTIQIQPRYLDNSVAHPDDTWTAPHLDPLMKQALAGPSQSAPVDEPRVVHRPARTAPKPARLVRMTPSFLVRSATDVVAAVPYLLGFHPADSLVVVGMHDEQVVFTARYDLPPADLAEEQAKHLAVLIARQGINGATLLGYGVAARVTPAVVQAAAEIRRTGITVLDVLRVTDGQFWSYLCEEAGCCPKPCPPADSAVAAAATFAGQVALPDRDALVAQLAPVTGDERAAMAAATARAQGRLTDEFGADLSGDDFARLLRRAGRRAVRDAERRYRSGRRLTDDEVAWLGVTLVDLEVRDYAWERTGEEEWRLPLWTDVLRRVEPGYVPAPAALLSFAAWRQGSGALARDAAERALAQDPEYRMAAQMDELLGLGLSPEMVRNWPRVDRPASDPSSRPARSERRESGGGRPRSSRPVRSARSGRSGRSEGDGWRPPQPRTTERAGGGQAGGGQANGGGQAGRERAGGGRGGTHRRPRRRSV
jgi:Domain of unknown function (DUF4192)